MSVPSDMAKVTGRASPATSDTRLHGRWPLLARAIWIILVALTLAICFGSLPVYLAQLHTRCVGTSCIYQQLTVGQVEAPAHRPHRLGPAH